MDRLPCTCWVRLFVPALTSPVASETTAGSLVSGSVYRNWRLQSQPELHGDSAVVARFPPLMKASSLVCPVLSSCCQPSSATPAEAGGGSPLVTAVSSD